MYVKIEKDNKVQLVDTYSDDEFAHPMDDFEDIEDILECYQANAKIEYKGLYCAYDYKSSGGFCKFKRTASSYSEISIIDILKYTLETQLVEEITEEYYYANSEFEDLAYRCIVTPDMFLTKKGD